MRKGKNINIMSFSKTRCEDEAPIMIDGQLTPQSDSFKIYYAK